MDRLGKIDGWFNALLFLLIQIRQLRFVMKNYFLAVFFFLPQNTKIPDKQFG
jgi:hypothetical protein